METFTLEEAMINIDNFLTEKTHVVNGKKVKGNRMRVLTTKYDEYDKKGDHLAKMDVENDIDNWIDVTKHRKDQTGSRSYLSHFKQRELNNRLHRKYGYGIDYDNFDKKRKSRKRSYLRYLKNKGERNLAIDRAKSRYKDKKSLQDSYYNKMIKDNLPKENPVKDTKPSNPVKDIKPSKKKLNKNAIGTTFSLGITGASTLSKVAINKKIKHLQSQRDSIKNTKKNKSQIEEIDKKIKALKKLKIASTVGQVGGAGITTYNAIKGVKK